MLVSCKHQIKILVVQIATKHLTNASIRATICSFSLNSKHFLFTRLFFFPPFQANSQIYLNFSNPSHLASEQQVVGLPTLINERWSAFSLSVRFRAQRIFNKWTFIALVGCQQKSPKRRKWYVSFSPLFKPLQLF